MSAPSQRVLVKNKAPAAVQITAEQLIREAKERELEAVPPPPQQKISDAEELKGYKARERKKFEDNIRKNRLNISHWLKYAEWEDSIGEIDRARSVFERALGIYESRNITVWLKYVEMEMKRAQLKHARTLFDRATYILPRVNQIWYKYVFFEEALGNLSNCRQVFDKWMKFHPKEQEWQTYINFEMRHKQIDRAREIYAKFVMLHPDPNNWIKFARFEERNSNADNARQVFHYAFEFFRDQLPDEKLYVAYAQFEERQHEYDLVRKIYEYALDKFAGTGTVAQLLENYSIFQKKHGDPVDIEKLIAHKRKQLYEEALRKDTHDYDSWFDYLKLAETYFPTEEVREIYEKAIACQPTELKKTRWRRYIYLWISYACYEEYVIKDIERAQAIIDLCLERIIPHWKFTFAKIWLHAAKLQARKGDIDACRRILDRSLELCPKRKLFKEYINLEIQLRETDNCRKLYEKFLMRAPDDSSVWLSYAELEAALSNLDRVRGLYKLAIDRPKLDKPEDVWRASIDFEIELEEYENVKKLYENLLDRSNHVRVWISYAQFYENLGQITKARDVYVSANERLRNEEALARVVLLEHWQEFEQRQGDEGLDISDKMPSVVKKRKRLDEGDEDDYIEYDEYVFPDPDKKKSGLMDRVKRWKQQTSSAASSSDIGADDGGSSKDK